MCSQRPGYTRPALDSRDHLADHPLEAPSSRRRAVADAGQAQRPVVEPRQNVPREKVGLVQVRISGQDEGVDAAFAIGIQLR